MADEVLEKLCEKRFTAEQLTPKESSSLIWGIVNDTVIQMLESEEYRHVFFDAQGNRDLQKTDVIRHRLHDAIFDIFTQKYDWVPDEGITGLKIFGKYVKKQSQPLSKGLYDNP